MSFLKKNADAYERHRFLKNIYFQVYSQNDDTFVKLFFNKSFHTIYIDILPTPNSSQVLATSLPTQLHVLSLFLKKKRQIKINTTKTYQNKIKQKAHTKQWSLFCVGQLLLGMGLPRSVVPIPSVTPLEKSGPPFPSRHQPQVSSQTITAESCQ